MNDKRSKSAAAVRVDALAPSPHVLPTVVAGGVKGGMLRRAVGTAGAMLLRNAGDAVWAAAVLQGAPNTCRRVCTSDTRSGGGGLDAPTAELTASSRNRFGFRIDGWRSPGCSSASPPFDHPFPSKHLKKIECPRPH